MKKAYCDSDVFLGLFNNEQDKVEALYTFDSDLIGLSNQIGTPQLRISNPDIPDQLTLPLDS